MKINILLISLFFSCLNSFVVAQQKIGQNPTSISTNTNLEVEAANGTKFTVKRNNGYVGIATTTPAYLLDVVGADASINGIQVGAGGGGAWANTRVGASALVANTSGTANTAIGYNALLVNSGGKFNVAVGANSLVSNTSGNDNNALGLQALYSNTTGSSNIGIGLSALYSNVAGSKNVAIGNSAGTNLTTGDNNIFIGYNVQPNISNTGSSQLNIGDWIYGDKGNIGIGIAVPTAKLVVNNATINQPGLVVTHTANFPALRVDMYAGYASPMIQFNEEGATSSVQVNKTTLNGLSNNDMVMLDLIGNYNHYGANGNGKGIKVDVANTSTVAGTVYGAIINTTSNAAGTKAIGLDVSANSASGTAYAALFRAGNVGIGVNAPVEALEISGAIKVGYTANSTPAEGTIRYNSTTHTFQGWNGSMWITF